MSNALSFSIGVFAGIALGAVYFAGLWWTVRRGMYSTVPALWFMVSMLARTSIVVFGFFVTAREDWHQLLACLAGFLIARSVALRLCRSLRTAVISP